MIWQENQLPAVPAAAGCAAPAAHPRRRRDVGLSTSHIRPQRADLWQANVYKGGSLIEIRGPGARGQRGGGKRGVVKRFSEGSRRRLLRALNRTLRDKLPVFVTLTYPDGFPGDPRRWKADLKAWFKRLHRRFPDAAGFWKLELEPRKRGIHAGEIAPHFHLLLWGLPDAWHDPQGLRLHWEFELQRDGRTGNKALRFWKQERFENEQWQSSIEAFSNDNVSGYEVVTFTSERQNRRGKTFRIVEHYYRDNGQSFNSTLETIVGEREPSGKIQLHEWISLTWAEVVGSDDPRHVRAGTRVEPIRTREGVMFYASKYISKLDTEAVGNAGRFWGMHNAAAIPWADVANVPLDQQQALRVMRIARRYIWAQQRQREHPKKIRWRSGCGMSFFCDASWWLERLTDLAGTG